MSEIYLPKLIDKVSDFVPGLKNNWQDYEAHKAETEADNVHGLQGVIQTLTALFGAEYGQNENGNWVRWNNGLQVCWIFQPSWPGSATNQTHGQEYRSDKLTWTYPKPFIENPVFVGGASGVREVKGSTDTGQDSSTGIPFRLHRALTNNTDADVWLGAIGWWKTPDDPAEWSEE